MKKKKIISLFLMLGTILSISILSGCTENTANISTFERIETEDFILVYVTNYNENALIDLIQDEYEKGNTYIDTISLDVALVGRSDSMILFQKEK